MVLSAAVVAAVLLSVMNFFSATSAPLPDLAGIIASPFRSASAAVSETVRRWTGYFAGVDALREENQRLKEEIADMEETVRQAQADRDENVRLREVAELRKQRRDLHLESARVLVQDVSNWCSQITVNKGSAHGVEEGDCVVTETGHLLGVVTETGTTWSTVRTILDSDTSIGALVFRTGGSAMAQGDFALMRENRLRLDYLPADCALLPGDVVVTSGLGGYYPSGLVIGSVEVVQKDDSGASSYAILAPEADLDSLTEVFVIKSFEIVT